MYEVTGVLTTGQRFKPIITDNIHYAFGINLFKGSVWERKDDGSRMLLKRVGW